MTCRYVLFAARFDPLVGGVESYTANVAHELARRGDTVTVVTQMLASAPETETRPDGVRVVRLPAHALMDGRLPLAKRNERHQQLLENVLASGVDRILVNNRFYDHSFDGLEFARRCGVRPLLLDHGSAYLTLGNGIADIVIRRYEHAMTEKTKRFNPLYCGVSSKSVQWLKTFGIETDVVLPNAIDAAAFRVGASKRDFRAEYGVADTQVLVAFVGRIAPEKGADVLVSVAQLLDGLPVHFILAGDGALRESLQRIAPGNVSFAGQLSHPDLSALLQTADVFCLPTRSEGFCTSLLEASACAVPTVIPDVGGATELIPDPSCGTIASDRSISSITEGLLQYIEAGRSGCAQVGEHARAVVESTYTWAGTVARMDAAFETCKQDRAS